MSKPHSSRLEDVSNLWIDTRIVSTDARIEGVTRGIVVREGVRITFVLPRKEKWHPLLVDYLLVGGDCELSCPVEQPFVILPFFVREIVSPLILNVENPKSPGPPVVYTEPKDSHC